MRARRLVVAAGIALAMAVTALPASGAARPAPEPHAVIGLLDTGINPYHQVFRDGSPEAQQHPSKRFPGYPRNAQALHLTLDATSYDQAVAADCERVWSRLESGRLYWFPGTTVVGAVSFGHTEDVDCGRLDRVLLLDGAGHGTMTASRAAGRTHGACPGCPVVVAQLCGGTCNIETVRWLGEQSGWLDVESHSWGPALQLWAPGTEVLHVEPHAGAVSTPSFVRAVETSAQRHLAFWSSGNGLGINRGVLGHPTQADTRLTPSVLSVGGHDSGHVVTWTGAPPHLASDVCLSWAAVKDSLHEEGEIGTGTSAATPYVAGGAARILLDARRLLRDPSTGVRGTGPDAVVARGQAGRVRSGPLADGRFTLAEWRRVLLATASARPLRHPDDGPVCDYNWGPIAATPVLWKDVPEDAPEHLSIGYGAVDPAAWARAAAVLRGQAELPDRSRTDEFFAHDDQVRRAAYQVTGR